MKISQIIQETSTTAGSVAPVEHGFVKMQTRNPSVYGGNKVGNLLKGKKTNKAFANSLNEAAMKDLAYDLQNMKSAEFQKKYGKSREEMKAAMSKQPQKSAPAVNETELSEQDLIVVPGQGRKVKTGFVPHDKDRTDHEVEMAVSDLFSAGKNAEKIYNMVRSVSEEDGLEGWVQEKIIKANDYLNTVREYLEGKELQGTTESIGTTGAMTNGEMGESKDRVDSLVTDALKVIRGSDFQIEPVRALKIVLGDREYNSRRGFYNFYIRQLMDMLDQEGLAEGKRNLKCVCKTHGTMQCPVHTPKDIEVIEGAKVDRMVKHVAKSEKKLGHSKKEAENIAWATANKRGMLDNKNKK
jgi:hypothetical protein